MMYFNTQTSSPIFLLIFRWLVWCCSNAYFPLKNFKKGTKIHYGNIVFEAIAPTQFHSADMEKDIKYAKNEFFPGYTITAWPILDFYLLSFI